MELSKGFLMGHRYIQGAYQGKHRFEMSYSSVDRNKFSSVLVFHWALKAFSLSFKTLKSITESMLFHVKLEGAFYPTELIV